ncbi:hypothetical protein [Lentzea sp. E54]|uniref:hypothetical protein n=1 Tax=Lentzea xerophila TaxID=3435883 RepID=UPI003DA1D247
MTAICCAAEVGVTFWPPFKGDRGDSALVVSVDAQVMSLVADSLDAVDVRVVHPAPGFESLRHLVLTEPPGRLALVDLVATGRRGAHLIRALRTLGWSSVLAVVPRHDEEAHAAVLDAGSCSVPSGRRCPRRCRFRTRCRERCRRSRSKAPPSPAARSWRTSTVHWSAAPPPR